MAQMAQLDCPLPENVGVTPDMADAQRPSPRAKRACDKCSYSRTRCEGGFPCARCKTYGYDCNYAREVKKRGRRIATHQRTKTVGSRAKPSSEENPVDISAGITTTLQVDFAHPEQIHPRPERISPWSSLHHSTANGESPIPLLSPQQVGSINDTHLPSTYHLASKDKGDSVLYHESRFAHDTFSLATSATTPSSADTADTRTRHAQVHYPPLVRHSSPGHIDQPGTATIEHVMPSCRYPVLLPLAPILSDIIPLHVACDLLQTYFNHPGTSLVNCTSPYVLTHILRSRSVLHPSHPRPTSLALLLAMLYTTAHTAEIACFHTPGFRLEVCDKLYIATLQQLDDPHSWHRLLNGTWIKLGESHGKYTRNVDAETRPMGNGSNVGPAGSVDDILTMTLLTIVISGGTYKADCIRWWKKALQLAQTFDIFQLDDRKTGEVSNLSVTHTEAVEEQRRICWLLFCLDRHFALSHNSSLNILDADVSVYLPLSEKAWADLERQPLSSMTNRPYGPSTTISGAGFFEFFLPLMTILGDIVLLHHRRLHPRLGTSSDDADSAAVEGLLQDCERSLQQLLENAGIGEHISMAATPSQSQYTGNDSRSERNLGSHTHLRLVAAYCTHILHVLAVLLFGKWDPLTMLTAAAPPSFDSGPSAREDGAEWLTPTRFMKCASHAVSASQAVATIIELDPELVFMPYLFGIYLLHGSFILLLFADRMPQLGGPNHEVEQACETIIRAHEICIVTLSTEFQRSFRRVLRSTLHCVRSTGPSDKEEFRARMTALQMYRWTSGGRGLAL